MLPPAGVLPAAPIQRWLAPVRRFLHIEAASGVVLLLCTAAALVLANSPAAAWFAAIWKTPVSVGVGAFAIAGDVGHLVVNDGLMALFFFVVGLEIKRELVVGELRGWRNALLPVAAAAGGMLVPAALYLALQWGQPGRNGWAVPMATDIAFVVGVLALFGSRVPFGLKILLLSLAIVDDLGAVLVIAVAFTGSIAWGWLAAAAGGLALAYALNRAGLRQVGAYVVIGALVWFAVYKSGVHPTVAGVALGLLTPASAWVGAGTLAGVFAGARRLFEPGGPPPGDDERTAELQRLQFAVRESVSPLHRLETALHPWVAYGIMPVFALANAGVVIGLGGLGDPVAVAVALGLALGKPVGILLFSWVAVRSGVTRLPAGVTWGMMAGGACLAGIGFTMALFLTGLSFPPAADGSASDLAAAGKIGTLLGSLVAGVVGGLWLIAATRGAAPEQGTARG
ncbi:Na+/H+ antiporter NhaA [Gemmata sp.]|uniref:Na+/H+ antiporter NhaA n=1 Tax=Gemmata sp. TaxID=1914242 RepID=UPI003F716809